MTDIKRRLERIESRLGVRDCPRCNYPGPPPDHLLRRLSNEQATHLLDVEIRRLTAEVGRKGDEG